MIVIDGSYHEGGGQIVRTAVGLSALFRKSVRIENIRAKRPNPGLSWQHVSAINAVADLCSAKTKGVFVGSKTVEFLPGEHLKNHITVKIPTAGAAGLVAQTIIIAGARAEENIMIVIEGGASFGMWAPPMTYIQKVFSRAIARFGFDVNAEVLRHGFYPKGGALVHVEIRPPIPKKAHLVDFYDKEDISGLSVASSQLAGREVAQRQAKSATKKLGEANISGKADIEPDYVDSLSPGSGIVLFTEGDRYIGASAVGEHGKSAESVGEEAALLLIDELKAKACVDKYLCDQLIPILAISGGSIKTSEITKHTETNIWVVEKFIEGVFNVNKSDKTISFDREKHKKQDIE